MFFADTSTPVVVLHCELGALSIMRTLGSLGVDVYGVTSDRAAPALQSRFCRAQFDFRYDCESDEAFSGFLTELSARFSRKPILIATSDETAIAVAENYDVLSEHYAIGQNGGHLVASLADKMTMFELAMEHGLPTPATHLPRNEQEAREYAGSITYPVMLKGAMGNRLHERTGRKMVQVNSAGELLEWYRELEDPDNPNLMIQELIPGDDDQVYIFNGYFDTNSSCLAAFTGRKIRQYPIHVGCASLGECVWVQEVADLTIDFMQKIGYRGILDIGYRKDPRDSVYKVLDINPRVGQAFRLFTSEDDLDVVRVLYADLTGQPIASSITPREHRRWAIEDYDLISAVDYHREGSLSVRDWLGSFKGLEETMWFSPRDPWPFMRMLASLARRGFRRIFNSLLGRPDSD